MKSGNDQAGKRRLAPLLRFLLECEAAIRADHLANSTAGLCLRSKNRPEIPRKCRLLSLAV